MNLKNKSFKILTEALNWTTQITPLHTYNVVLGKASKFNEQLILRKFSNRMS